MRRKGFSVAFPRVNIKVRVGGGVSCFKEQVILHNLGSVACGKKILQSVNGGRKIVVALWDWNLKVYN